MGSKNVGNIRIGVILSVLVLTLGCLVFMASIGVISTLQQIECAKDLPRNQGCTYQPPPIQIEDGA